MAAGEYIQPDPPPTYTTWSGDRNHQVKFTDISEASGIAFTHVNGAFGQKWMPETMGAGAAFFDYDADGLPDVLLINSAYWPGHEVPGRKPVSRLYRNRGQGTFEDVTERAGLSNLVCYGMGVAIADYDGDGAEDIYVTAVGKNHLLRNDSGRFVDVTEQAGVGFGSRNKGSSAWEWSTGAMWIDHDRDGDLDLFVANYVQWTPETDIWTTLDGKNKSYATPQPYKGASCVLFRNEGDGTFTDATRSAGLANPNGKSLGVIAADLNDDGWPDIVVTNDTQPNFLYINNRDGTFTDQALSAGVAYDENGLARAGMGVDVSDVGNSGFYSIAIGNFSGEPVSLYTRAGRGAYIDKAGATRLSKPTTALLTFGLVFADFDLDGFEDLMLANGHIEPSIERVHEGWTFAQRPQLFLNNRRGQFVEISGEAGSPFLRPIVGRALAVADIDNDGDIDALLTSNAGPPVLLRNETPYNAGVVRVRLVGSGRNLAAIGARLSALVGEATQSRYLSTGGSYLSQSELVVTFGLGRASRFDRLRVRWPGGSIEEVPDLPTGWLYVIKQGAGVVRGEPLQRKKHLPGQAQTGSS